MEIKVLSAMPYAQAHVRIGDDGAVYLISYTTLVAEIDAEGWLRVYGLYSQTTRRHIGAFVREYANCDYSLAKLIYEDDMVYNILTGEVLDYANFYDEE